MKQHVTDLCEIIGSKDIPEENPCKDHATIHLKNYLRMNLKPGNTKPKAGAQVFTKEDLQQCGEILVKLILSCPET